MSDVVVRFVSETATTARLRRDWFNELIRWCRDRGIKTDTAIAAYLKINRSTLHRWKWGTPPTPANIDLIVAKTFGEVDPRRRGK